MDKLIATIDWGLPSSIDGLHGTLLTFDDDGSVRGHNELRPSGLVLQSWSSESDYQSTRRVPALPLLDHGLTYYLVPKLEIQPEGAAYLRVQIRNRFGEEVMGEVLYAPDYRFTMPLNGQHYTISLLSGGCDEVHFTSFELWEVNDG